MIDFYAFAGEHPLLTVVLLWLVAVTVANLVRLVLRR